jgi:FlaA1/EpsC-like NDP-sugar epimerase
MLNRIFVRRLLDLPRPVKRLLAVAVDAFGCYLTLMLALYLRLEEWVPLNGPLLLALGFSVVLSVLLFGTMGLYAAIFRHAGWGAVVSISRACGVYGVLFAAVYAVYGVTSVPRTVGILQPLLMFGYVAVTRLMVRLLLGDLYRAILRRRKLPGLLIYGAGHAGRMLAAAVRAGHGYRLVGFLDDDPRLQHRFIDSQPVYPVANIQELLARHQIHEVMLAMPSAPKARRSALVEMLRPFRVRVRTLPNLDRLPTGQLALTDVQDLDIEELMGRDPVPPRPDLLGRLVQGRTVLVTGAGGSIGSELVRQIASLQPDTLVLLDNSEHALYQIDHELQQTHPAVRRVALLGSVADARRMGRVMQTWRPHTVYHAAAYKHVPLVEHNVTQGLHNNVWGTWTCAQAALDAGVSNFVLVSTDKAVRPTNVMGASKRLCEMVLQALAHQQGGAGRTCFTMVRFGNVLGSSGSVVPLFRKQIAQGGPVTLTHADITRYFMTIPEAAQLVLQAGAMGKGGEVYVLDMGEPVRIADLARKMIQLSGYTVREPDWPEGDIEILTTGLRPGEKLYEELLIGDNTLPTDHPRILSAHEHFTPWTQLRSELLHLATLMDAEDQPAIRLVLQRMVSGYTPDSDLVDWVYQWGQHQSPRSGAAGGPPKAAAG